MKKLLFRFILPGLLLLSLLTFAQSNSNPVTTVNGKEYYQYTIQSGDGLLSIGRKFKISSDEITKANPDVINGLKEGQEILIPILKKSDKKKISLFNSKPDFIQHKVEKKQTLFSISRKYKVSIEEIVKYNPGIEKGMQEGNILQIPVSKKEKKKIDNEKPNNTYSETDQTEENNKKIKYITHKVHANETLFSISKRYNVEITDIIKLNPGSDSKLVVGSELKILPVKQSKSKDQKRFAKEIVLKSTFQESKVNDKSYETKINEHKVIRIAYLLPLMLDQVTKDPTDERFINFYQGSLLAINDAKRRGISFEIYTFDTEKTEDKITEILKDSELKKMDLIIGPAYSNLVPYVEKFAKENKINTLIPFTSKVSDIDSNPYLFQFNPGEDTELNFFYDLILGKYKNVHIVFAKIQDVSPTDEGKIRVDELQNKLKKEHRSFSTIELSSSENVNFNSVLKKGEKNLIIFNTDKFSGVSSFINPVSTISTLYDVVLFEQFSWRNLIDKSLHCIYLSPFITKFNPTSVSEFNMKFDQYFGKDLSNDSPRYDILGYDLSTYFIFLIHHYGSKFGNIINSNNERGIQSEPLFERYSHDSGFINQQVYLGEDKAH
jgi:LysM repeat protein